MLQSMATYAPAFGMIGTLIGLILMLGNLDESGDIGAGLSIALITTLYGTIFANLIFAPLSGKLEELSVKEINEKEMLKTAIISLSNGENPRILEKKMLTYVTPENRKEYARMYGDRGYSKQQEEKLYSHWLNQQKDKWENTLTDLQAG
jgi:chemotaxis protein MotA